MTTVNPGQALVLRYPFIMHPGMGRAHRFEIALTTDSAVTPVVALTLLAVSG